MDVKTKNRLILGGVLVAAAGTVFFLVKVTKAAAAKLGWSAVHAELVPAADGSAWMTADLYATAHNQGDGPITKILTWMWSYFDNLHPELVAGPIPLMYYQLTLDPAASKDIILRGNYNDPETGEPLILASIGQHTTHTFWLEDESGNKSPVATVIRP